MRIHLRHSVLLSFLTLAACSGWPDGKRSKPPQQSIEELRALGVSFTSTGGLPRSVAASCSDDGMYIGELQGLDFYMSPSMNHSDRDQINDLISEQNNGLDITNSSFWWPYSFVFSIQNSGGEFLPIEGVNEYVFTPELPLEGNVPNQYPTIPDIKFLHPEFILFGDFYLQSRFFSVPVSATHIELWFSSSRDSEPTLINRGSLEDLYIWRTFIMPFIESSNGSARCLVN